MLLLSQAPRTAIVGNRFCGEKLPSLPHPTPQRVMLHTNAA
jgi:hypothetical protein